MNAELRRFYRCSLTGERSAGTLIVRSRRIPCLVRNRSIGGFGVEIANDPQIGQAGVGMLECAEGTFPVQIVHLSLVDGRLALGLSELVEDLSQPAMSAGQVRGLSLALGMVAAMFLAASVFLALNAEHAANWLQNATWPHRMDRIAAHDVAARPLPR